MLQLPLLVIIIGLLIVPCMALELAQEEGTLLDVMVTILVVIVMMGILLVFVSDIPA